MSHRHTVVLIEDYADLREAFQATLVSGGCEVLPFAWPEDALRPIYRTRPCTILLDPNSPLSATNAHAFVAARKRFEDLAGVPLVLISGAARSPERAAALGAVAWTLKPVSNEVLLALVDWHCGAPDGSTLQAVAAPKD